MTSCSAFRCAHTHPVPCQHSAACFSGRRADAPGSSRHREAATAASRRDFGAACAALVVGGLGCPQAQAVQGLTAGRIVGTKPDPELGDQGINIYERPEGKSGGHGVGWSEIPRYSFRLPSTWGETPVSIADAGGTEIDIRFSNRDEGELQVVVAPILRFKDVGYNANVGIEDLGSPDKIIAGFTPELFGKPLDDGDLLDSQVYEKGGHTYYQFYLKPHRFVTATATGNRLFLLAATANSRQFRKGADNLRMIANSFYVPPEKSYNTGF